MSQQALDLRKSIQIVRRHKVLVGILVGLGVLGGSAYAVRHPPLLTSTALVVLPQSAQNVQSVAASGQSAVSQFTATQLVIAQSNPVLSAALPNVRPAMSLDELRRAIQVNSLTAYVISLSASAKTTAEAETDANAVANSYVAYVNGQHSPTGDVSASILEPAASAAGKGPVGGLIIFGLIGALVGALIGVIVALAVGRSEKRLRERDEIANSVGLPVLASFPVRHPRNAAGWMKLFEDSQPGAVHVWNIRKALQQLGMPEAAANSNGSDRDGFSLVVLSLSSDIGAIAIGPQLATFAASMGIPTTLVIGPQQDMNVTATLRTACAMPPPELSKRPDNLHITVSDGEVVSGQLRAVLTVVVVVVDGKTPQMPEMMRATTTVVGVSAGAVTAEQLARVAVNAAADGREVAGILVADPDPADQTTGRIPRLDRPTHGRQPTRLKGLTTEIRR